MAIVAFVDDSNWCDSVIEHAAWAAKSLSQPLTIVAREEVIENEPALGFDAYQHMDAREDMFRELATRAPVQTPMADLAAREIVQTAARRAKDLGVEHVRTITTSDSVDWFIENATSSNDLLVVPRHDESDAQMQKWTDHFLKARRRMILLAPKVFAPVNSWLAAIDGKPATGRAVDYLTRNHLLQDAGGTAIIVGSDYQCRLHFRDAVKHLKSAGHDVTSYELKGQPDDVLVAVLTVLPADLLVMGAYGQGRFRSLLERSSTSHLLRSYRGPVLLARA